MNVMCHLHLESRHSIANDSPNFCVHGALTQASSSPSLVLSTNMLQHIFLCTLPLHLFHQHMNKHIDLSLDIVKVIELCDRVLTKST